MWSAAAVLVCALELLGRSADTFPPIAFLEAPPAGASANVEAFVRPGEGTIFVITSSAVFRAAQASPRRCGNVDALKKLASILVHEEWHVRHGPDERGAYQAQLMTLMMVGAGQGTAVFAQVSQSMRAVVAAATLSQALREEAGLVATPSQREVTRLVVRPR